MPAAKKHPSTRARRNKATTAATLKTDATTGRRIAPELPERTMGWHSQTVIWWADVWASPMSDEWHPETDVHNVLAAAMHYDDMWRAETPTERQKADAAFVKREAALGLTPYDRRRLEWTIETAAEARDRGQQRRARNTQAAPSPASEAKPDPRVALHAVN